MLTTTSPRILRLGLAIRRRARRAYTTLRSDKRRYTHLGKPPHKNHPLRFIWELDGAYLSSWALHGESMLMIWQLLKAAKSRSILEIGSGLSSLMFGAYAKECLRNGEEHVRVVTVEHDGVWMEMVEELLGRHNLDTHVHTALCPLHQVENAGMTGQVYDFSKVGHHAFDFVLIDGPPENVGRGLVLPSIISSVNPGSLILLDDVQRQNEYDAMEQWLRMYSPQLTLRGLAIVGTGVALLERS